MQGIKYVKFDSSFLLVLVTIILSFEYPMIYGFDKEVDIHKEKD